MLLEAGVDLLGFPLKLAVHSEDISVEETAKIVSRLGISSRAVLITYLDKAEELSELASQTGCRIVQIHGDISPEELKKLHTLLEKGAIDQAEYDRLKAASNSGGSSTVAESVSEQS